MSTCVSVLLLLPLLAGPPSQLPDNLNRRADGSAMTGNDHGRLKKGTIFSRLRSIPKTRIKKAVAVGIVDAPPEVVFKELTNPTNPATADMPYVRSVKVGTRHGNSVQLDYYLDLPWPLQDRHYAVNTTDTVDEVDGITVYKNEWTYVAGSGNITDTYGSFNIVEYEPGRSLVRYTVFADPGGKIPKWAQNLAAKQAAPGIIKTLRKRVLGKKQKAD